MYLTKMASTGTSMPSSLTISFLRTASHLETSLDSSVCSLPGTLLTSQPLLKACMSFGDQACAAHDHMLLTEKETTVTAGSALPLPLTMKPIYIRLQKHTMECNKLASAMPPQGSSL